MDVPEDAEIGTDGAGLALLAILGTNVHWLEVGNIPNAEELYSEAINQLILERLRRIDAAGGETETGVIIVTLLGYISGVPSLFSKDFHAPTFLGIQRQQNSPLRGADSVPPHFRVIKLRHRARHPAQVEAHAVFHRRHIQFF